MISNVNSKQTPKRALFANLPFEIGPGLKISVAGYNILQPQKPARTCFIYLGGEKAQIAVGETTKLADDDAGSTVQKVDIKKAYKFGGEQVLFSPEEQAQLKDFGPTGLRIIGFKPQSMLPDWASITKSTFIYPSEADFVGSTRVFTALWQKLLKDKKMGIAWLIARKNSKPQIVAVLPSPETLDPSTGQQTVPAGLWLYPLPFADDIRQPPQTPRPLIAPDPVVDAMRVIIQQLQLPGAKYEASKYPNPSLQWHYRILQAIALDEEIPEFKDGDDKTIPKYRQIDKRAGAYVMEWGELLEEQYKAWALEAGHAGVKRDAAGDAPAKKAKVAKVEHGLEGKSKVEMKALVANETISKSTVAELKSWLAENGLSTIGKKTELIDRIEQAVEEM